LLSLSTRFGSYVGKWLPVTFGSPSRNSNAHGNSGGVPLTCLRGFGLMARGN